MTSPSLPEKVVAIDSALEGGSIAHAFGGALALAYYAEPRLTLDIDVNVFVPSAERAQVRDALRPLDVNVDAGEVEIERDGQCRWWWDQTPVDVFFAYDPFHEAMSQAIRRVPFGDDRIPILSPEHLIVCKVAFDRAKDWLDIEQMLVAEDLDVGEIATWADRIVGKNRRLRALLARRAG